MRHKLGALFIAILLGTTVLVAQKPKPYTTNLDAEIAAALHPITAIRPPLMQGTTITVCATGCTYNNSQLQTALNAAVPGDTVLVQGGFTYTSPSDGFVLGAQCKAAPVWDCITLRTGVTSTGALIPTSSFPADGVRMSTGYRGTLAKFLPSANNEAAIRTIYPGETGTTCAAKPCRADGWTLKWLEIGPKADWMQRALVRFGTNKAGKEFTGGVWVNALPGGEWQDTLVEVPTMLSFIQNDIHGDPIGGQHQGLLLSAKATRVLHNSFTDFKSLMETQAITALNGYGPDTVENNLIEGSGENSMWGGDDSYLQLQATISGTPTTTTFTLSSPVWMHADGTTEAASLTTDIYSGIFVSVTHAGIEYASAKCVLTGSTCTLPRALPVTPSVGDVVKWTLLPGGLTYRYNHVLKPLSWFTSALSPITGVTVNAGTGGALASGNHCYVVIGYRDVSGGSAGTPASSEACVTTAGSATAIVDWPDMTGATSYRVYGNGATGTENQYWVVTASTFTDNGTAGTSGSIPAGTLWVVKNNFELKNAEGEGPNGPVLIEGNIMDYSWCCSQNNIVSIKVNNQGGKDVSATVRGFTFRNNWIRHGNRGLALSTATGPYAGGYMENVTVENNLWTDMSTAWSKESSSGNSVVLVSTYNYPNQLGSRGCVGCILRHNTFLVSSTSGDMPGPLWFNLNASTDLMANFILRDNIMARDCISTNCVNNGNRSLKTYNPSNTGQGTPAWTAATTGSSFADHNAWPDGSASIYTAGPFTSSFFPTDADLKATHMVDYAACNADTNVLGCGLKTTSNMHNAASDGTDIGANTATIKTFTDVAIGSDAPPPPPPPASAPIFVAAANGGAGNASTVTTTSLAISGTNRYVVCAVATQLLTRTGATVTLDATGQTLTKQLTKTFDNSGLQALVEYWDIKNPTVSTGTVTATVSGGATAVALGCLAYENVDQTTPYDLLQTAGASSNAPSVTVPSATDDLVIDLVSVRTGTTGLTEGAGQTNRVEKQSASGVGNVTVAMSEEAGAASVVMSWAVDDATSKSWASIGASLNPASSTPPAEPPTITTTTPLPTGVVQTAYNVTLVATGGTTPYTWSRTSGTLPAGITLNATTGTLSGTPTSSGTSTFTIRVTDATAQTDDQVFTLRRLPARPLSADGDERNIYATCAEPSLLNDRIVWAGDLWVDTCNDLLKRRKVDNTWETLGAGSGGATALSALTDVAIATPANNQSLRYNSSTSKWTNQTVNAFTQGGNAFGAPGVMGTIDAQPINLVAGGITRIKTDATASIKAVTLQANGDNNPELYVTQGDASDWMSMGFTTGDGRRVVAQTGAGTMRSYQALAGATAATNYIFGVGSSSNSGGTNTRWIGVRMDGLFSVKHLSLESGTRPTCGAAERGTFWYVAGATGVKDTVEVCTKDAADVYAWRVIY